MSKQERPVSKEILERIEKDPESCGDAGNKVLDVTITYSKNAYRTKAEAQAKAEGRTL